MSRLKLDLSKLGGQLGVGLCALGLLLVFLGWNGAASRDRVPAQFPYLLSGGIAGLCLVVVGVGMLVVQSQRADRAALQAGLDQLRETLERIAVAEGAPSVAAAAAATATNGNGLVVSGKSSYHRPTCHLVEGRDDAQLLPVGAAEDAGLNPCRICKP